jgi:stage V sporulation protein B
LEHRDIARRSVRGSLVLFSGNFGATGVLAIAVILIARLLGPTDFGTYTLALVIPGFLSTFLGFGVNTAVIRYTAYGVSQGRPEESRRFTLNAIRFLWLTGAAFTLLEFVFAEPLAAILLHRPALFPYVELVSLTILANTFLNTISTVAIGWNQFSLSALSNVATAFIKLGLAPVLIVLGFGVTGALVGHLTAYVAGGIIGTAVLYYTKLKGTRGEGKFVSDVKELLRFGLPLYAGSLLTGLASYLVTFILAFIATNTVYGYYAAANNFTTPISLVSSALTTSLFPAFAAFDGVGGNIKLAFRHAYRFVAFLITPVIFFMLATAPQLIHVLYGFSYDGSIPYLQLLAFAYLPIAFGYTVHPAFFNGFNKPRLTMTLLVCGAVTLMVAAPLFSLTFGLGVDGLIYAIFLSFFVAWAVGTFLADRYMDARLDLWANLGILIASVVSYGATIFFPSVPSSNVLTLVVDFVLFAVVYLTLAPLLRAVKMDDLEIMQHSFSGLGILSKAFGVLLRYERFLLSLGGKPPSD